MAQGWIKLHRTIRENWIWQDRPFSRGQAWVDLLLRANHKDTKVPIDGIPRLIKRRQFLTSLEKLGEAWGWERRKVRRFLVALGDDGMLTYKMSKNGTMITIVNYDFFQGYGTTDGTTDGTADGIQTIMNKNDNNDKNQFKRTSFHNFEQNKYDFESLERMLLDRSKI